MTITQISRAPRCCPRTKPFDWDLVPLPGGPTGDYAIVGQAGIGVLQTGQERGTAAADSWPT